jgi:hypothetical protein
MEMQKALVLKAIAAIALSVAVFAVEPVHGYTLGQVRRVSRRTTRRVTRRRLLTLPGGYTTVVRAGTTYYVSGGVYYVQQMDAGNAVYVEVDVQG